MRHFFKYLVIINLVCAGLFAPFTSGYATLASGTFVASHGCDAYVSKNKLSDPYPLSIDSRYDILETTGKGKDVWLRIRVSEATPNARWVKKTCGAVGATSAKTAKPSATPTGTSTVCEIADKGESYVLALSWNPGFCSTRLDKLECRINDPKAYQASNFTLHGLWPNQTTLCGINYGYCGEVKTSTKVFCDYPPVPLSQPVQKELAEVMPSVASGTCLERHEWHKHGACQTIWNADAYFETAIVLTKQFNESGVGAFMADNVGKTVTEADFNAKVDSALGVNAHNRLRLTCNDSKLIDVFIDLPSKISVTQKLADLIALATPSQSGFSSNCNGQFRVAPIGSY